MACHFSPQLSCGNSCFPLIHNCSPPKAIEHLTRSTQTRQVQRLVMRACPPGRRLAARLQVYLPVLALELAGEEVELQTPLAVRRRDDSIACACEDRIGPSHPVSIVLLTCGHSHVTYLRAPNRWSRAHLPRTRASCTMYPRRRRYLGTRSCSCCGSTPRCRSTRSRPRGPSRGSWLSSTEAGQHLGRMRWCGGMGNEGRERLDRRKENSRSSGYACKYR